MSEVPINTWLVEPMLDNVRAAVARLARRPDAARIAVMPDVHLGESTCIGVVLATRRVLYLDAVGADIGCGMSALAFDADASALASSANADAVLAEMSRTIPIIRHRSLRTCPALTLDARELSRSTLQRAAAREGAIQLGTLGRGNHFIEFQTDGERLWLMVHSGSRAAGRLVYDHHLPSTSPSSAGLDLDTHPGQAAWNDVAWAAALASENRGFLVEAAARAANRTLGVRPLPDTLVDLPHNVVARETHAGEPLVVHRKGAAPAFADAPGLIPGSMGTHSYHVRGRGCEQSMCSSSHGAGRALTRTEATRTVSPRALERQMRGIRFDSAARRLVEEAPAAYKDIDAVMRAQAELVRIERRLRPLLVFKGT